jgi:hypothetical protein
MVLFIPWRVAAERRAGSCPSWSRLLADVAAFFLANDGARAIGANDADGGGAGAARATGSSTNA